MISVVGVFDTSDKGDQLGFELGRLKHFVSEGPISERHVRTFTTRREAARFAAGKNDVEKDPNILYAALRVEMVVLP